MNNRTKFGLGILVTAFVLGVLGDALLRSTPWGINIFLWTVLLLGTLIALARWQRIALTENGKWLILTIILFAALFVWRDSRTLKTLDAFSLLIGLSLLTMRMRAVQIRLASILEYALGVFNTGLNAVSGSAPLLSQDIQWKEIRGEELLQGAKAAGRGVALALPLLLIFGGLFTAADSVFATIVNTTFEGIFDNLLTHILLTACCAWLVGGFLHSMLLEKGMKVTVDLPSQKFSLGIAETGVVLGLLNALFLCFVIVQFSYLFGGESVINTSPEMTYAEYARRGFFELVIVAASVLPLLLLLHWLLPKENPNHVRIFRLLAGMLIGLLFVIMASALKRMWLYQRQYGLTELRLYTTAFIGWLAVVFIWFIATVLRGGRERFAFGALVSGFLAIVILHGLNPDAFIVRVNVARVESGHNLDTRYATSLSADAVPELIEALPHLSLQDGYSLANRILKGWSPATGSDWRRWSWGRSRAQKLVQRHKDALERFFPDETEETSRFR